MDIYLYIYVAASASHLKTAGELKIALARTSRRSMWERCTSIIDSNIDKPGLRAYQPASKWLLSPIPQSGINLPNELYYRTLNFVNWLYSFLHHCLLCLLPYCIIEFHFLDSDGTIYRIVSNIAILRSYRGISLPRWLPLQRKWYLHNSNQECCCQHVALKCSRRHLRDKRESN